MKIKTGVKIVIAASLCIVSISIGASLLIGRHVREIAREARSFSTIIEDVNGLRGLTYDYLLYPTDRAGRQWLMIHDDISHILTTFKMQTPNEISVFEDFVERHARTHDIFERLIQTHENETIVPWKNIILKEAENRLTAQLLIETQSMVSDVSQLSSSLNDRSHSALRQADMINGCSFTLVSLFTLINSLYIYMSVVKPILKLHEGIGIVGSGNLDHKAGIKIRNEVGDLSKTFDHMTDQLKVTMVSRDELIQEVEERKRLEEELRESKSRLDLALRSAEMGVWHLDLIENERFFDGQVCHLLGIDPGKFTGKEEEFFNAVHPDDRKAVIDTVVWTIEGRLPYETEYRSVWPDGSVHHIIARGKLVNNDKGEPVKLNGLIWDITERKQIEELLRKSKDELESSVQERTAELRVSNRALTEYAAKLERLNEELQDFAFIAAHDLQEPLRKIQTFGHMLAKKCNENLDEQGQDYLIRITKSAKRMSDLIHSLLDYSRIATQPSPFEPVELAELAREAVSDLEFAIQKVGGTVEIVDLPPIDADAAQIRQLLQNLIANSMKYCKDCETPVVRVHGRTSGTICTIFIEDNGIGFEEEYIDRIFKPFQQLHGRNENYGGTGMGLAICRKIVERHEGSISAKSTPGKGATFIVQLPVKQKERS